MKCKDVLKLLEAGEVWAANCPDYGERNNFKEVELGFRKEQAINEAKRCLRCDLEQEV